MKKTNYVKQIIIISSILILVGTSCRLTGAMFPGIAKTSATNTPNVENNESLIDPQPTIEIAPGSLTISFSEDDLLGWIKQYQDSQPEYSLQDASVKLDNGVAQISGKVESGLISGTVDTSFTVSVSPEGTPVVGVESMKIGNMEVPEALRDQFAAAINNSITTSLVSEMNGRTIQSITIEDGRMTIISGN
jgi:hypothetical protein